MKFAAHLQGLSEQEAAARLAQFGPNLIHETKSRTLLQILVGTLHEPMFLLLLGAATLYLVVGDLAEGLFLTAGAVLSLGLVIVQEARSERALQALNALAEPRARVIRDGELRAIAATLLVPGDLVVLGEGHRIPADAILVDGDALEVDESTLTGEAVPSTKKPAGEAAGEIELAEPGEAMTASLFASTLVARGQGVARVVRTGSSTQVGSIGERLREVTEHPTLVQRDIRRLIKVIGLLAILFCGLVAGVYGVLRNDWFGGALSGLTLAISLVPEEFPMVLTIFMALGALRLARRNVLVRRSAVIETLGATTLLCVDKTGTLTENRMALRYVWRAGRQYDLAAGAGPDAEAVIAVAQLASSLQPHDPMDLAVQKAAAGQPKLRAMRTYPLRPEFLAFVQVWCAPDGMVTYAAKGAHEAILALCPPDEAAAAEAAAHGLGALGIRVLAVASAEFREDPKCAPETIHYRLEGLLGFEDPVRGDVPQALAEAASAGVSVAMITGDFPATAFAAGKAAGISTEGGVITGPELTDSERLPPEARIFARVMPDQKLRLVEWFKKSGHVVAMTGDGINDAPAIAAADVGIAMGQRGTDVAREAADLILLDDRFASIVGGIALGRRIFSNLRRALTYITAVHVPVAGLALFPLLLGLPPLLYPMHLVLLELLLDPLCALVFEGEPSEPQAMKRPPRPAGQPLFGSSQLLLAVVQGLVLLAAVLAFYAYLNQAGVGAEMARAAAFVALVVGHLSLALAEVRAHGTRLFDRRRVIFWSIAGAATAVLTATIAVPFLAEILRFSVPRWSMLGAAVVLGIVSGGWYATVGTLRRRARPV